MEKDQTIHDPDKVAEVFNDFFINVASDLGDDLDVSNVRNHPSVVAFNITKF